MSKYKTAIKSLMTTGFRLTNYDKSLTYFWHPVTGETKAVRQSTGRVISGEVIKRVG